MSKIGKGANKYVAVGNPYSAIVVAYYRGESPHLSEELPYEPARIEYVEFYGEEFQYIKSPSGFKVRCSPEIAEELCGILNDILGPPFSEVLADAKE